MKFDYEVLIVGGGPAGLSAGMTLGRIARTALICDDDRPRNAASTHLNNFPTQDGIHPAEWRKAARQDLEKYKTIEFFKGSVLSIEKEGSGFKARLSSDNVVRVKKIILAVGIKDRLPEAPGFKELWGKAIFHCPFCHGFEVQNQGLGIVSNGFMAEHILPMIYALSKDLILFTNGPAELAPAVRAALKNREIKLVEEKIERLLYDGEVLKAVRLTNGDELAREGLFISPILPFEIKSSLGAALGCETDDMGLYKVSEIGETTVPGVFAAGDNMTMRQSVLLAAAAGTMAGFGTIHGLLSEDFNAPL